MQAKAAASVVVFRHLHFHHFLNVCHAFENKYPTGAGFSFMHFLSFWKVLAQENEKKSNEKPCAIIYCILKDWSHNLLKTFHWGPTGPIKCGAS